MELTLVRHTTPDIARGTCYGQTDVPLKASLFGPEAGAVIGKLGAKNFQRTYSSPLTRCVDLANKLSSNPPLTDDRLLEINFGAWEGRLWGDIPRSETQPWMDDFVEAAPPGGESFRAMYARVEDFLQQLAGSPDRSVLTVTHAGVIRCAICWVTGLEI